MSLIYGPEIRDILDKLKALEGDDAYYSLVEELRELVEYEDRADSIRVRYPGIADETIRNHFNRERERN